MKVVLADLKSNRGFVSKDTVVGGYGSRLDPFSRVTAVMAYLKQQFHDVPSVHMAYIAAILARAGHEVSWTRGEMVDGDVALVLSSLVDHKNETAWADRHARARREGRVHRHHGVEDARAVRRSLRFHPERRARSGGDAAGAGRDRSAGSSSASRSTISIRCRFRAGIWSPRIAASSGFKLFTRPVGGGYPLLASRGCPEFCTYCPHRILAGYRARSIANIADELERLCDQHPRPYVIFRDPLFSEQRDRCLELCDRDRRARPDADVRGGNAARSSRHRSAESAVHRRLPRDELRRRVARPGDAEEVGPPADSAGASARDHRALPQARHRHGGVLRARVPAGRLELDRGDDRLRDRSRVDVRAVQDADAVSGHADVQADSSRCSRRRTGRSSTATRRRSRTRT